MLNKLKINNLKISFWGNLFYYLLPYRKKIIANNIDTVFADTLSRDQKIKLIKAFYTHLVTCVFELIRLRFISEEKLKSEVEVLGYERLLNQAAKGKGVLILTGHFGNWEVAPIGGILNFKDFKGQFHFIRRTLSNKKLEQILFKRYYKAGLNVIPKKNSLQQVSDALEQNHAVVFVLDQHASLKNRDGIAVEFFCKKAGTYRSLASIARYTDIPIIPAAAYRKPDGKHVLEFHAPIVWEEHQTLQESLYQNTLKYNQAIERIILEHPEQWLWLHKRWKLAPQSTQD